jgi:hypothetical protein
MRIRIAPACCLWILVFGLMALAFAACTRFGESSIKLPTNPVLSGGLGWAVVKDAYVRLKESPSDSAKDLDHLRRGGVFVLDARKMGSDSGDSSGKDSLAKPAVWYGISSEGAKGWVRESELDIYASQAQAEKAASAYR